MPYVFADCQLDPERYLVVAGDQPLALEPKSFDVLHYLVQQAPRVVPPPEVLAACWADTHVNDEVLTQCISKLRQALGPTRKHVITTVRGRGYQLGVAVTVVDPAAPASPTSPPPPPANPVTTEPAPAAPPPVASGAPAPVPLSPGSPDTPAPLQPPPVAATPEAPAPPPGPPVVPAEQRQVTVLSCAVVDVETLLTQLPLDNLYTVIQRVHATCAASLTPWGGALWQRKPSARW